jgi:hypothetical protein
MKSAMTGQLVIALFIAALLAGCGSNSPPGLGVRSAGWTQCTRDKTTMPGTDHAAVHIGVYANKPALVLRTDGQGGSFDASWDRTRKAVHYEGAFTSRGERKVAVQCCTIDGKTGPVMIGDETFELGNGSLFLLVSCQTRTVV